MAEFPTKLRIGPAEFKVEDWAIRSASMASRYGECDHLNKTIRVCRDHGVRKSAETFLHEMFHAIFAEWTIEEGDKEERIVTTLGSAMCCAMRDNPEAFEWLKDAVASADG